MIKPTSTMYSSFMWCRALVYRKPCQWVNVRVRKKKKKINAPSSYTKYQYAKYTKSSASHHLQPARGLFLSSGERKATAITASGHTIRRRRPARRRRSGAIVTDIMAIWWTKPQQTCSKCSLCIQCIYTGLCMDGIHWSLEAWISPSVFVSNWGKDPWNTNFTSVIRNTMDSSRQLIKLHNIYDLVPKGAHTRGYALQLKIKHCWKLFLFEMLCCVLARMNEYIVQLISATRLWLISRYSHHTMKKHRKMTAKNSHPCTEWFLSLCLQTNRKHMEKQSLNCTRKTSFYTDNINTHDSCIFDQLIANVCPVRMSDVL